MKTNSLFIIFCIFVLLTMACGGLGGNTGGNISEIFADLENGIKNEDESLFKKHWHSEGYSENLVGGSGLAGNRVYEQGSRKIWFPKPDLSKTEKIGKVEIVPTEIYNWEKEKRVDEIYFAIAEDSNGLKILGGGEDLDEVKSLAKRFNEGKSLSIEK